MLDFSICIPTHRLDKRLLNTLNSLSYLDYPREKFEICLLVNGFPEQEFNMGCDHIKVVPALLGPSEAKNQALSLGKKDWLVLLDSDDFLVPSALKQIANYISNNSQVVLGCEFSIINFIEKNVFYPSNPQDYEAFYNANIAHAMTTAGFGRPIVFKRNERVDFDLYFNFAEERKLFIDYWNQGKMIDLMGTSTYVYNWNESGISGGKPVNFLEPEKQMYFRHFTDILSSQDKNVLIRPSNEFVVPDTNDEKAIHEFLRWET